ncbi:hypothetical protein FA13DRAFT_1640684, partial [Coprinellus micaceus]
RYCQVPTFSRDTIRRFSRNVLDMKQLGARDFEDLLQCALPTFEGLLPDGHNDRIQDLLFAMAHWHALSKLRMHTDTTLQLLDSWTSVLGEAARTFAALTCSLFQTRELKSEYEARKRKESQRSSRKGGKGEPNINPTQSSVSDEGGRKPRGWSLSTPKFHSLGDVVNYIKRAGTTDSYSTQLVCYFDA